MRANKRVQGGKHRRRSDHRTLKLADYCVMQRPLPPPPEVDLTNGVKTWPMMGNDEYRDCTCAAAGHLIMEWTAQAGHPVVPSDRSILAAYSAVTGFVKKTRANNRGAVVLDVLNYWRKRGIAGHRITAFLAVDPLDDRRQLKLAVSRFGGCYVGLDLKKAHETPASLHKQRVWRAPKGRRRRPGAPDPRTGHVVVVMGYNARGLRCVSWDRTYLMTWNFWEMYGDEAFAILSPDWLGHRNLKIEFNLLAVMAKVRKVARLKRGTSLKSRTK